MCRRATTSSLRKNQGGMRCSGEKQDATSVTAMAARVKNRYSQTSPPAISEYREIQGCSITTKLRPTSAGTVRTQQAQLSSTPASDCFYERCKAIAAN